MYILKMLVGEESATRRQQHGEILSESDVECIPENISISVKDSHIDIKLVRQFFNDDGFEAVLAVCNARREQPWTCAVCDQDLSTEQSLGCESCLEWLVLATLSMCQAKDNTKNQILVKCQM